jgi:hypothetical protein
MKVGTEITAGTAEGTASITLWSAPQLTPYAEALIRDTPAPGIADRCPTPQEAQELRAAVPALRAGLHSTTASQIATMMGRLAVIYRAERISREEAKLRLETYQALLEDVPPDILLTAFRQAAQTIKFFPTVAEIRELAAVELQRRRWMLARAEWLIKVHETRWKDPEPEPSEAEREEIAAGLRELAGRIAARFPTKRETGPLTPRPHGPKQGESSED